jgi:hypothetical protein
LPHATCISPSQKKNSSQSKISRGTPPVLHPQQSGLQGHKKYIQQSMIPNSHAGQEERHSVRRRTAEAQRQRNLLALRQQLRQNKSETGKGCVREDRARHQIKRATDQGPNAQPTDNNHQLVISVPQPAAKQRASCLLKPLTL